MTISLTDPFRILVAAMVGASVLASPVDVSFESSSGPVHVFDFVEVSLKVTKPDAVNPFTDVQVTGECSSGRTAPVKVDGFCDSMDGSVFRIRFMPSEPGRHEYSIVYRQGGFERRYSGEFTARDGKRKGLLRLDPERSEHFIWQGTGEHYFWNGTTTYYLMGWEDEAVTREVIDRLAAYKINRLRVLVYGRNEDRPWGQPVKTTPEFKLYLNPWPAERPDDVKNPGFDLSRFNVSFWQKYERMLRYAREREVIVSVIFFIGGQVLPTPFAAYSEDETRFYRYAVARLAPFANVTWDLGNEHNFHREVPKWCDWLGPLVKEWDPYDHLTSAHNVIYRTPGKTWIDMQLIQRWDEGQNRYMLGEREKQAQTGRGIPQINEEYGYEDLWEKRPGQRSAETRRRLAWEIAMAGCYQTTGETANRGVGFPPDSGGGWVSGRGDAEMVMLRGYRHMADFFTSFEWWRCVPRNGLAASAMCLAAPGETYAVYLPNYSTATLKLEQGKYRVKGYDPKTGSWSELPAASGPVWAANPPRGDGDWAWLLERDDDVVDSCPPMLLNVSRGARDELLVRFSEALDPVSAALVDNYTIAPEGRVLRAELSAEERNVVKLTTSRLPSEAMLALRVSGVADTAAKPNRLAGASLSFLLPDLGRPLVNLSFEPGYKNAGRTARQVPHGHATAQWPQPSTNTPPSGGRAALELPAKAGPFAFDPGEDALGGLRGLTSFTITGWLNCINDAVGPGGNRVVTTINNGGDGFDLVFLKDGRLQLSVNEWPDGLPTASSKGMIPADAGANRGNWRFFAVTYDGEASREHLKFYFGTPAKAASLDKAVDYSRGAVGSNLGPLTIGHFNSTVRDGHEDRMFRGLIDEVRIYGSTTDGTGALSLQDIRKVQDGSAIDR